MRKFFFVAGLLAGHPNLGVASEIRVEVISAKTANVNSFIFFDSVGALVVDASRTSKDAAKIAEAARKHGVPLEIIFVTHGHPDHYIGLGALKKEFPNAQVLVANKQVKQDIIKFARAADQGHWLGDEPLMRPKSELNPQGFDYEGEIHTLNGKNLELPGGAKLEVLSSFPPTEAEHETLLYSKDLNSLFASDLVYNEVHLWFGGSVTPQSMKDWQVELNRLKEKYVPLKTKIYPGHGKPTNSQIFDIDIGYIKDFFDAVKNSETKEEAKAEIIKKYPAWENADFILMWSLKTQFDQIKKGNAI